MIRQCSSSDFLLEQDVERMCRNLKETGECVINVVSENMMATVNATSVDAPYRVSEWAISGLYQAPCTTVKPARIQQQEVKFTRI
jgi:flavin reductase (DIM6/NTAB) family NADH-FMN oxidoreductase RutF